MKTPNRYIYILVILLSNFLILNAQTTTVYKTIYYSNNDVSAVAYSLEDFILSKNNFDNQTEIQRNISNEFSFSKLHNSNNTELTPRIVNDLLKQNLSLSNYSFIKSKRNGTFRFYLDKSGNILSSSLVIRYKKNEQQINITSGELTNIFNYLKNYKLDVSNYSCISQNYTLVFTYVFPLGNLPE